MDPGPERLTEGPWPWVLKEVCPVEEENCASREEEPGPERLREGPWAENCPCPCEEMWVEV